MIYLERIKVRISPSYKHEKLYLETFDMFLERGKYASSLTIDSLENLSEIKRLIRVGFLILEEAPDSFVLGDSDVGDVFLKEGIEKAVIAAGASGDPSEVIALQEEVSSLKTQNTSLQGQVTALTNDKSSLQGQVTTLTNDKNSLQGQVTTLTNEKSTLQGQVTTLTSEKTTLTNENTSLKSQVSTLTADKTSLQNQVTNLEGQVTSLNQQVTDLQAQLDALQGTE